MYHSTRFPTNQEILSWGRRRRHPPKQSQSSDGSSGVEDLKKIPQYVHPQGAATCVDFAALECSTEVSYSRGISEDACTCTVRPKQGSERDQGYPLRRQCTSQWHGHGSFNFLVVYWGRGTLFRIREGCTTHLLAVFVLTWPLHSDHHPRDRVTKRPAVHSIVDRPFYDRHRHVSTTGDYRQSAGS